VEKTMISTANVNSIPDTLKNTLLARADQISMLPAVAMEALNLTKNPDCTAEQLAKIVERDVKLAAEILSLSNSAFFSMGQAVVDLRNAIVRLGFKRCRNLILTSSASSLMKNLPLEEEWIREILWQHSFTTAIACGHLNNKFGLGFQGEEFTAGLLHDIGRLLLAIAAGDRFSSVDSLNLIEGSDLLAKEEEILESNHCEFGAWFAEHNGLPQSLVDAIRFHHDPWNANENQELVALIAAGDHIANHLQRLESAEGYDPSENLGISAISGPNGRGIADRFDEAAPELLNDILLCSQESIQ
jgi:HD-like signal output (HDOD) protein